MSLRSGAGGGPAAAAVRPERGEPAAGARADRPRPVVCVIEHLHRDRSVADAVLAGRYHHAGVTLQLGPEPDWRHGGLPADEEWRIEWSKFYEGLDLAHAYRQSGDPAYLDAWVWSTPGSGRSPPAPTPAT